MSIQVILEVALDWILDQDTYEDENDEEVGMKKKCQKQKTT